MSSHEMVATQVFDFLGLDPLKHHRQLRGRDDSLMRLRMESSGFQALVPNRVSRDVPPQSLDLIAATIEEHEDLSRGRILRQETAAQPRQAIEAFAHVRGGTAHEKTKLRTRRAQHEDGLDSEAGNDGAYSHSNTTS